MAQLQRQILPGILVVVALLYGGVLYNDFVWDDHVLFVDNAALRTGSINWPMLSRPVMEGTNYFRPLVLLTWALEARAWGINPLAAHAINLGLLLLNVALLFVLTRRVLSSLGVSYVQWRAGIAAIAYALHPALVEVSAWVSGRFDLMATAFILSALIVDTAALGKWSRAALTAVLFALALGCKELALMLPPILLAMRLVREYGPQAQQGPWREALAIMRKDAPTVAGLAIVFAVWFVLRADVLGLALSTSEITDGQSPGMVLWLRVLLVLNTIWFYAGQILVPFANVSPLHPLEFEQLHQLPGILRAAAGVLVLAGLIALLVRHRVQGLMLGSAALALLPVLQLVLLTSSADSIGSDRFLTLPLCFVAITLASLPFPFSLRVDRRIQVFGAGVLGGGWLLLGAATILGTIPLWRNEWVLWTWAYEKNPEEEFAQRAYIHAALRRGQYEAAGAVFDKLRARGALHSFLQIQYGMYLLRTGEKEESENYIKGGLGAYGIRFGEKQPSRRYVEATITDRLILAYAYNTLAEIEQSRGRYTEAVSNMDEVVRYLPHVPMYAAVRGLLLIGDNRMEEGEDVFRAAYERMIPAQRLAITQVRERFLNELCVQQIAPPRQACPQAGLLPASVEPRPTHP